MQSRARSRLEVCQYRAPVRQAVKSAGKKPSVLRGAALTAAAVTLATLPVHAQKQAKTVPGLIFGGRLGPPPKRADTPVDPSLPTGPMRPERLERPGMAADRACSFDVPVCLHRGRDVSEGTATRALEAVELAYRRLVLAMGLTPPARDGGAGGTDALDVYLEANIDAPALRVGHAPVPHVGFDSGAAFCVLGPQAPDELARSLTMCVAEAITWRLDASETPHARRAYAAHIWHLVGTPTNSDYQAIDDFQANPQRAVAASALGNAAGAAVLFDWMDRSASATTPGALGAAMFSLSAGSTPPDAPSWRNEPDLFDIVRHSHNENYGKVADTLGRFAAARAMFGSRDDGQGLPEVGWSGSFGRVRFDWSIPFSTLPRRVASYRPIEPTGSIYIHVNLDKVPEKAELGFRAEWEPPVSFKWTMLRLDSSGQLIGNVDVKFEERARIAERTVVDLKAGGALIIVGLNMGGVALAHPFDPDVAPFEPHACTVYLAKL